jgi:predicted cobalt transporter CbtA
VQFGDALLDSELARRDDRKRDPESTARALVVATGALMTILLSLAKDAGMYQAGMSWVACGFFILSLAAAVVAAGCAVWTQLPASVSRKLRSGRVSWASSIRRRGRVWPPGSTS